MSTAERRRAQQKLYRAGHAEELRARNQEWRQNAKARDAAWREENQHTLAAWFEAPPEEKDAYFRAWEQACPFRAGRLRGEAASTRKRTGKVVELRPALARLEQHGRDPVYGISGASLRDAWPGKGVSRKSWNHAEADAFRQAIAAGWHGGSAVLAVDHDPCAACTGSFAGFARMLGLDQLDIYAQGLPMGTYTRRDGHFRTAAASWWSGYGRGLPDAERDRLRRDPLERAADAGRVRLADGRPPRMQVTTPQRTAAFLRLHLPPDARRELGRLLLEDSEAPRQQ